MRRWQPKGCVADTTTFRRTDVSGSLAVRVARVRASIPAYAASWAVLVFALGTTLSAGLQRHLDPTQGTQRLIEFDIGEAFALAAVLSLLLASPGTRPGFARIDLGVLVLCTLTWFLPEPHAVYAGMTLAAAWLGVPTVFVIGVPIHAVQNRNDAVSRVEGSLCRLL